MIDLGDVQPLSIVITDSSGAPADAGAVVLTIGLPDGTSSTPALTHAGVGLYSVDFATTQPGRHELRWVATGANAGVYTDVFEVRAPGGLLISLAEARRAIGTPSNVTTKDEDLRTYIDAATPIMEDLVGPIIPRAYSEWLDGGARTVMVLHAPILSVEAVLETTGSFQRVLTEQPLDGATFDSWGYTVDLEDGLLSRRMSGTTTYFAPGRRNIRVDYTAGRGVVKGNLLLACRRLIRHFWQQEQQGVAGRPDANGTSAEAVAMTTTPSGFAVPRAVVELVAESSRIVGMA